MSRNVGWIVLILMFSVAGCTTRTAPVAGPNSTGGGGGEAITSELNDEIEGARVELSSAKEELGEVVAAGKDIDPAVLDAILESLESAEARLDKLLERAIEVESGAHDDHDD